MSHSRSSMKVGVDGVLIALWTTIPEVGRILDVGTGCGIISLICAQRSQYADILAIDIDNESVEEAGENFQHSPWSERLQAARLSFEELSREEGEGFDLIISNPPYFDSGVAEPDSRRLTARHQGTLSPGVLLEAASALLNPDGRLSFVVPAEYASDLEAKSQKCGLIPVRVTFVKGHEKAPVKRALMEFMPQASEKTCVECERNTLTLETSPGFPTDDYRSLGKDFYLKF